MKIATRIALLALIPLLCACNTVRGVGKDITAAGHAIEKSADTSGKTANNNGAGGKP
jgi:predicted small secreted protein